MKGLDGFRISNSSLRKVRNASYVKLPEPLHSEVRFANVATTAEEETNTTVRRLLKSNEDWIIVLQFHRSDQDMPRGNSFTF